ncbi:Periplasmic oligopeptide-binding protein [subsurface metagenome]
MFGGLVRLDDSLKPAPDIADSWQVSDDGRSYTFYLRRDVKFHNGQPVKAGDFKYSWERAADPATGSQTAATYLGDIVGVSEVIAGRASEISGVRVIDDYTLQVTIDTPKAYFLSKLTYTTAFVVDRANVASGGEKYV